MKKKWNFYWFSTNHAKIAARMLKNTAKKRKQCYFNFQKTLNSVFFLCCKNAQKSTHYHFRGNSMFFLCCKNAQKSTHNHFRGKPLNWMFFFITSDNIFGSQLRSSNFTPKGYWDYTKLRLWKKMSISFSAIILILVD
jgi:hypothetical protein